MSHLFTIGPVEMFPETSEIGGKQVPYFRNDEFSQVVFSASAGLKRLLFNENGKIILLTCSGTGAMEATIMNCFTKKDNLIIIYEYQKAYFEKRLFVPIIYIMLTI